MSESRPGALGAWRVAIGAVIALYALMYLGVVVLRIGYAYELEWMEGGMLAHALRLLDGQSIYAKPDMSFVAFMYPPLYYYASAGLLALAGEGFGPLRALSFASSLACFGLMFRIVHRETKSAFAGCIAAGLLVASYERSGAWFDLARADSFYLLWMLLAIERLRADESTSTAWQAGLALACAFFVKQSVALIAAPVWLVLWFENRRRALAAAAGTALFALTGVALLQWESGGWFLYYTFSVPRGHPIEAAQVLGFWPQDIGLNFGLVVLAIAAHQLGRLRISRAASQWFWPALVVGALASSWSVRSLVGAHLNNLFPVFAVLALAGGLAFHAAFERGGAWVHGAGVAVLLQFALLGYDPRALVPGPDDAAAGDSLVARIAAIPGEVYVPNHGYLARRAGKREFAHTLAIDNLLLDDFSEARKDLEIDFLRHFRERRFAAVIIESDGRYKEFAEAFYGPGRPVFDRDDVFFSVSGGRIRPETLHGAF